MEHTLHTVYKAARALLSGAGVDNPTLDSRLLISHVLGCMPLDLITQPERKVSDADYACILALIARRVEREPVSRILGVREFWGLSFGLHADTLDPRADSETLVEVALARAGSKIATRRVLDLGTGTGCLLLALLHEWPHATGIGVDVAEGALGQAQKNAEMLGFSSRAHFLRSNWFDAVDGVFDVIVSNPPYIPADVIPTLMPEVRMHDPLRALVGGEDGLDPYRHITAQARDYLTPHGLLIMEIGIGQGDAVTQLFLDHSFVDIRRHRDLGGVERCVSACLRSFS